MNIDSNQSKRIDAAFIADPLAISYLIAFIASGKPHDKLIASFEDMTNKADFQGSGDRETYEIAKQRLIAIADQAKIIQRSFNT